MSTSDQDQAADSPIDAAGVASHGRPEGDAERSRRPDGEPDMERAGRTRADPDAGAGTERARSDGAGPDTGAGGEAARSADVGTDAAAGAKAVSEAPDEAADAAAADTGDDAGPEPVAQTGPKSGKRQLTPRQARRLRVVLSSVGMVAMGVVLALRIASRSSVLVVGVYGLALILCGIVIELSRNGRTRLGTWLLVAGLAAAIGSDWLLIP
ncbi:hypothetical protein [Streptomyces sp. NPDC052042]|uniref:hypothetical protein n=1 Tax=Streptomyces sp. NPDC052042 TaxID=3365683 RepID=UPI0037CF45FC